MTIALARTVTPPSAPAAALALDRLRGRGWDLYLIVCVALTPIIVPEGPGQTAIGDAFNLLAVVAFAGRLLLRPFPVTLPLLLPVLVIATGSMLAITNALSLAASAETLLVDLYLYSTFVVLVALLSRRGDLRSVRIAWLATAVVVALGGIASEVVTGAISPAGLLALRGPRLSATFVNPNVFADYLVFSLFIGLGLERQLKRSLLLPSFGVLLLALISTKSNGGLVSLTLGGLAYLVARLWDSSWSRPMLAGVAALAIAIALAGGWALTEWGAGSSLFRGVAEHSFLGRMGHSSESRQRIWQHLRQDYARSPLGIGPGNSAYQMLAIGERERPDSFLSKEAHNDFLAYAIERGPLGLVGLLLFTGMAFACALGARRRIRERLGGGPGANALWAAVVGSLVATTVHSTVIEKMHFRHFWLFLAVLFALAAKSPLPDMTSAEPAVGLRPGAAHPPLAPAASPGGNLS